MKKKIAPLIEYVAESSTACLVTMVQGNLLALTMGHLLIASQTGVVAGSIAATTIFLSRSDKRWIVALVLGLVTGIVDFFMHPQMFGSAGTEAVVTGVGAAVMSYILGSVIAQLRMRLRTN